MLHPGSSEHALSAALPPAVAASTLVKCILSHSCMQPLRGMLETQERVRRVSSLRGVPSLEYEAITEHSDQRGRENSWKGPSLHEGGNDFL